MENLSQYNLVKSDPIQSFINWREQALKSEKNPDAVVLATSSQSGDVSARMMLFKGLHDSAFSFYTSLKGAKAQQLRENPKAEMVFWWESLGQQVRVKGSVEQMSYQQTLNYFESRDRDSQIASIASHQGQEIASRAVLEESFKKVEQQFQNTNPVLPPNHWSGFLIHPQSIEFFIYGAARLNDRFCFRKEASSQSPWQLTRLSP